MGENEKEKSEEVSKLPTHLYCCRILRRLRPKNEEKVLHPFFFCAFFSFISNAAINSLQLEKSRQKRLEIELGFFLIPENLSTPNFAF